MTPLLLAAAVIASPAPPPASVPPPPTPPGGQSILAWIPGEVRCAGAVVVATPMRRPWVNLIWGSMALTPLTYGFSIDADGRTTGIRRLGGEQIVSFSDDIAPSLAATRFAAGVARGGCSVTYVPRQTSLGTTPAADLVSYSIMPLSGPLPREGWARIEGTGNCAEMPRPEPLVLAYPDYRSLPGTPGVKDGALVDHDLDAGGRPVAVRIAASTGNDALDAAAIKAVAGSRFSAGSARHGCLRPYSRAPATLAAPPLPLEEAVRPAEATCPGRHDWSVMPTLRFPEPYRRRAIEGWAIIGYDVAPWGEIGNAHVIAAEPTAEFGTAALGVIRSAKVPTTQGLVGCIDKVRFRMPNTGAPGAAPAMP
jgi:hypothetical protein